VLLKPGYWRNANLDSLLRNPEELTTFLSQGLAVVVPTFQSWIASVDILLLIDEDTIFNNGTDFALASSAHKCGEDEYMVGSDFVGAATRFRVEEENASAVPHDGDSPVDSSASPSDSKSKCLPLPSCSPSCLVLEYFQE